MKICSTKDRHYIYVPTLPDPIDIAPGVEGCLAEIYEGGDHLLLLFSNVPWE